MIEFEEEKEKRLKKSEENLKELWDTIKRKKKKCSTFHFHSFCFFFQTTNSQLKQHLKNKDIRTLGLRFPLSSPSLTRIYPEAVMSSGRKKMRQQQIWGK